MATPSAKPDTAVNNNKIEAPSQPSPTQNGTTPQAAPAAAPAQPVAAAKGEKKQKPQKPAPAAGGDAPAQADGEKKLSGAEMKKRAKEEKAIRRAAEKAAKDGPAAGSAAQGKGQAPQQKDAQKSQQQQQQQKSGAGPAQGHRRTASQGAGAQQGQLPVRGKAAVSAGPSAKEIRKANKEVGLFGHLYTQPKRQSLEGVSKEVHPAVLALGLQMSNYVICGSNARCVGMLLAFKKAIQAYQTPQGTSLARHLTSHHLSPQIDYLKSHRPISVSMGNAIRWLKDFIIHIDPDTPQSEAKEDICSAIDFFIRERITVADTAISSTASTKIRDGSTVVTFAKSSVVEKTLLRAHERGTKFTVVVLDSRPLFEGRNLARSLAAAGIPTRYMLHSAASHALKDADLVLLGAHAMMSNGRLYSRVGTAAVAMLAHSRDIPVIVCCESLKFTDRVALDSIVLNEIAPPDELVIGNDPLNAGLAPEPAKPESKGKGGSSNAKKAADDDKDDPRDKKSGLQGWRDVQNLQLLNVLYDVTPAEYINMIISEYGSLPPSSVPVVHRIAMERDMHS